MKADRKRAPGFYWVRFEGERIVAEYVDGQGCIDERRPVVGKHWHVPGSDYCFKNSDVCELLDGPLVFPASSTTAHTSAALPQPETGARLDSQKQEENL